MAYVTLKMIINGNHLKLWSFFVREKESRKQSHATHNLSQGKSEKALASYVVRMKSKFFSFL